MPTFLQQYRQDDRDELGDGPWSTEPDKATWIDSTTDLDCMIVRNPMGALCGYVGVPTSHPWWGKDYSSCGAPDCVAKAYDCEHDTGPYSVNVHGGLTFAGACHEGGRVEATICHVPLPGRDPNVWWFGFDTAHYMDFVPRYHQDGRDPDAIYRDVPYLVAEVEALALQCKAAR